MGQPAKAFPKPAKVVERVIDRETGLLAPEGAPKGTTRTEVFEGPFDLLLHLILRDEVDLYSVQLTAIVDITLDVQAADRMAEPEHEVRRDRFAAHFAADAIGAEILSCHGVFESFWSCRSAAWTACRTASAASSGASAAPRTVRRVRGVAIG